jgi:two-component system, cell cycle sensor histidine kinase and response regulator CckA
MNDSATELENLRQELAEVKERLKLAEETLQAIHSGEVDAIVVATKEGDRIFTLQSADHIYRHLIEQMGEGAATVSDPELILYSNQKLSELLNCPLNNLIGS